MHSLLPLVGSWLPGLGVPWVCPPHSRLFWPCREMRETNGLLTEELEGLQRKLGRQEKMQEALVDLELEKEVSSGCIISPGPSAALSMGICVPCCM